MGRKKIYDKPWHQRYPERQRAIAEAWKKEHPKEFWGSQAIFGAKRRSQKSGVVCTITRDFLLSIMGDRCPVFGNKWVFGQGRNNPNSPTVDRLNPDVGYIPENVRVISWRANAVKYNGTAEEHRKIADWMEREGAT